MVADSDLDAAKYVFLESYLELDDESLEFCLAAGSAVGSPKDVTDIDDPVDALVAQSAPIVVLPQSPRWVIRFPSYLAMSIRDESFALFGEACRFEGGFLRRYSASPFLDYMTIGIAEYATDIVGPFVHWGFVCQSHVVDIASVDTPAVSRRAA